MAKGIPAGGVQVTLGLDLGVGSIGWCLVEQTIPSSDSNNGGGLKIKDMGVRIFPAGSEGDYTSGRESSLAAPRRLARAMRVQRERRRRRLIKLAHELQRLGLLPAGHLETPVERDTFFKNLDAELRPRASTPTVEHHTWLYRLFAQGITGAALTPHQLGRVIYHAAQLRGFQSNAKERAKSKIDAKASAVYSGIQESRALRAFEGEPLVTALARLDPEADHQRIRGRYTSRDDRRSDLEALLSAQAAHHATLSSSDTRTRILEIVFHQRPLKSSKQFIGRCSLNPDQYRGEMALPSLQRLRILQRITDLEVTPPGEQTRPLTGAERTLLRDHLYTHEEITFTALRKLLGFPAKRPKGKNQQSQPPFHEFNFEREDSTDTLIGDRTHCALSRPLGTAWSSRSLEERDRLVATILEAENEETALKQLIDEHGLTEDQAETAIETSLEIDRGRFSAESARRLCALLDTNEDIPTRLSTALRKLRGDTSPAERAESEGVDFLPPYLPTHPQVPAYRESPYALRNPTILRVLRELRLVVNAIIRKHGKPDLIRIEFARELKNSARKRQEIAKKQKERASERDLARKMLVELGYRPSIAAVTMTDIEKWLLGVECNWHCPYSGSPIPPSRVFSPNSDVQIEHIIPRALSLDNSFANKTLALAEWNIVRKARRSPHAAFSASAEWPEILRRVSGFTGAGARGKLARFQWDEEELNRRYGGFTARHLQDTAWAARLAKDYLAVLYGAQNTDSIDATGTRRIEPLSGVATGLFRQAWNCSEALLQSATLPRLPSDESDRPKAGAQDKLRADHRHHAIDALVIALTSPRAVAELSAALSREIDLRDFRLPPPAPDFNVQLKTAIERIVVSHRVNRRASGALHQATYYQAPRADGRRFQRVPLTKIKPDQIALIVDRRIQKAVQHAWSKATTHDPAKWFAAPENLPRLETGATIKRVTLPIDKIVTVALGPADAPNRQLHVKTGGNFCVVVVERSAVGKKRKPCWEFRPITLLDATHIIAQRSKRDPGKAISPAEMLTGDNVFREGERALFTIRSSEAVQLRNGPKCGVVIIGDVGEAGIEGAFHNDGRGSTVRKALGASERIRLSPSALREADPQKITIGPLGEIYPAND
jgi:CRISPR-associated endonuclease Csn1